jgi:hypothetical protein
MFALTADVYANDHYRGRARQRTEEITPASQISMGITTRETFAVLNKYCRTGSGWEFHMPLSITIDILCLFDKGVICGWMVSNIPGVAEFFY